MTTNRREFIEHLGATAMLGALPLTAMPAGMRSLLEYAPPVLDDFDLSWTNKLNGKAHKAVLDCAEIESGFGVWRAGMWEGQYLATNQAKPGELATVLVLRHKAFVLALQQSMWDSHGIGGEDKVTHPITQQSTDRNPVLLSASRNEIPAQFDPLMLPNFIAKGGIALACAVAMQFFSGAVAKKAGISEEEARKRVVAALVPGVVLQPSGVFACIRAQEAGCAYVRAS
jgi:hypothetical protein